MVQRILLSLIIGGTIGMVVAKIKMAQETQPKQWKRHVMLVVS